MNELNWSKVTRSLPRQCFALTEILLVFAITAITAVLLLPIFNSTKDKECLISCGINAKPMGALICTYIAVLLFAAIFFLPSSLFAAAGNTAKTAPNSAAAENPSLDTATDARLTPVTLGDAVIEPFWDKTLGAWSKWKMTGNNLSVNVDERWCMIELAWKAAKTGDGPVLQRNYAGTGVTLGTYSHLVFSAGFPVGTKITLKAQTDQGEAVQDFICKVSNTSQYVFPLPAASKQLRQVSISFSAAAPGQISGNLLWLGVRDPQQAKIEQDKWKQFSAQPLDVFLRSEPEPATVMPLYNILCPAADFQKERQNALSKGTKPLGLQSQVTLAPHLGGANHGLFGRDNNLHNRAWATFSLPSGKSVGLLSAAQAAALANDLPSLREVAKAAVQLALIPHWDVDFITAFPDSSWEQRSFAQAEISFALTIAFDLAGSWLTPAGKILILRRLAEDGLGNINYTMMRYPYMFTCNQAGIFSVGRLAIYALLEKQTDWGHVAPHTDLAFAELNENIGNIFVADGGFPEGSGYLVYTLDSILPAFAIYGNARNKPLNTLLPPLMAKIDDYLEVLRSTEKTNSLILVADAQGGPFAPITPSVLSVLSKIRSGGAAERLLAAVPKSSFALWALPAPELSNIDANYFVPFVRLPESGFAASSRKLDDKWVKLVVVGGPANAGHNHQDRGSFVLEFAGETFAADPGGLNYAVTPYTMKFAQNHNMLVPIASGTTLPSAQNPAPLAVIPDAKGDAISFDASINPGVLWPEHYKIWRRAFASPSPAELTITDEYELIKGDGVEFLWHTPLPVTQANGQVIIQGARGKAVITPPAGTTIEIIPHRDLGCRKLATIIFRYNGSKGKLSTQVLLKK
jgi:hypothetical protein